MVMATSGVAVGKVVHLQLHLDVNYSHVYGHGNLKSSSRQGNSTYTSI